MRRADFARGREHHSVAIPAGRGTRQGHPKIRGIRQGVEVLAQYEGKPALVQRKNVIAAAFHPELTGDTTVHERFLKMARERLRSKREVKSTETSAAVVKSNGAKAKRASWR